MYYIYLVRGGITSSPVTILIQASSPDGILKIAFTKYSNKYLFIYFKKKNEINRLEQRFLPILRT